MLERQIAVELLYTDKETRDWKIMLAPDALFISRFFSIYFIITGARNMFVIRRGFRYIEVHHSPYIDFFKARVSKQENEANASLGNIKKQPYNNNLLSKTYYLIG